MHAWARELADRRGVLWPLSPLPLLVLPTGQEGSPADRPTWPELAESAKAASLKRSAGEHPGTRAVGSLSCPSRVALLQLPLAPAQRCPRAESVSRPCPLSKAAHGVMRDSRGREGGLLPPSRGWGLTHRASASPFLGLRSTPSSRARLLEGLGQESRLLCTRRPWRCSRLGLGQLLLDLSTVHRWCSPGLWPCWWKIAHSLSVLIFLYIYLKAQRFSMSSFTPQMATTPRAGPH